MSPLLSFSTFSHVCEMAKTLISPWCTTPPSANIRRSRAGCAARYSRVAPCPDLLHCPWRRWEVSGRMSPFINRAALVLSLCPSMLLLNWTVDFEHMLWNTVLIIYTSACIYCSSFCSVTYFVSFYLTWFTERKQKKLLAVTNKKIWLFFRLN